jgi:hypothetical protein
MIDAREWGVKDMSPYIKDDVLKFKIKSEDEYGKETEEDIELNIRYIDAKISYQRSHGIWPIEVEVEANNGKVVGLKVTFTLPK